MFKVWSFIISAFLFLLSAVPAQAQFGSDPTTGLSLPMRYVHQSSIRFYRLQQTEVFQNLVFRYTAEIDAEMVRLSLQREPGVRITSESSLDEAVNLLICTVCPKPVGLAVQSGQLKRLNFESIRDPQALARCISGFDALYSDFIHWNRLRMNPRAEPQPVFTIVKKNPALQAVEEGGQAFLQLRAHLNPEQLSWFQSVLDASWNVKSDFPIRVVAHPNQGNALKFASLYGTPPIASAIAGNVIGFDPNLNSPKVLIHEIGRILGFPDCDTGVWDSATETRTSHQTDPGNIMCSFAGRVTSVHHQALKQAYLSSSSPSSND